jgi:hypothetical protein
MAQPEFPNTYVFGDVVDYLGRASLLELLYGIENMRFPWQKSKECVHVNNRIVSVPGDGDMLSCWKRFLEKAAFFQPTPICSQWRHPGIENCPFGSIGYSIT